MIHKLSVLLSVVALASMSLTACGGMDNPIASPTSTFTLTPTLTPTSTPTRTPLPTSTPTQLPSPTQTSIVCRIVSVTYVPGSSPKARAFDYEVEGFQSGEKVTASLTGIKAESGGFSIDVPVESQIVAEEHGHGNGTIAFGNITVIGGKVLIPHDLTFTVEGNKGGCKVTQTVSW